jgi:hypothetical protein
MDYLREICLKSGIEILYVTNKITILSFGIQNNNPCIRVHKIFRDCPRDIADAIAAYSSDLCSDTDCIKKIGDYAEKYFSPDGYRMKTPDQDFLNLVKMNKGRNNLNKNEKELVEAGISSIVRKNFYGESSMVNPEEPLVASTDDVMELDIVIKP